MYSSQSGYMSYTLYVHVYSGAIKIPVYEGVEGMGISIPIIIIL